MATFALVHGVCAGGYCWELLSPYLEAAGHAVVAVDLPCDEPTAANSDYANVIVDSIGATVDEVLVVGHSTGGLAIPLVADLRPVHQLVFLCALIPTPGKALIEQGFDFRGIDPAEWQVDNGDGSFSVRPEAIPKHLAQDADTAVLATGGEQRLRPQFLGPFTERCPLDSFPDTSRHYMLCREDHIISPAWSRRAAAEMLGIDATELPGGHMPMVSRPQELSDALLALV
jgi:pimeloyl-ACP methyl ester carboxylesterase